MTDTPTTLYGLRLQGLGDNVNTWGDDKLNNVITALTQIAGNIKDITLTGDYTITSTNYITTADNKNAGFNFEGTLTANATVTVPSAAAIIWAVNATTGGYSVQVKTAAGTGITIPNGRTAALWSDGVNVYNLFPTHMGTDFTPSLPGDAANVDYVDTAIANATIPAAAGTVLVSGGDTTAGYLFSKLLAGTGINLAIDTPSGDESAEIAVVLSQIEDFLALVGKITATISSGTTAMTANRRYRISAAATGTLPTLASGQFVIVEFTVGGGVTATVGRNSQTIDGVAADDTYVGTGSQNPVVRYDYASAGAVTSRLIEGIPI